MVLDSCHSDRNRTHTYNIRSEDYYYLAIDYPIDSVVEVQKVQSHPLLVPQ